MKCTNLIYKFTTSVIELRFHADWAWPVLFSEFSFKRSVVFGPKFLVPRVFFQKICGFRARVQADRANVLSVEVLKPKSLLKLSPQSQVLSPDQSRSQVPTPRLKKPGPGRAVPRCVKSQE
jgi:hypothetical protein